MTQPLPSASAASEATATPSTSTPPLPVPPLPSRLRVPLPAGASAQAVLPPGTRVTPGQPLLIAMTGTGHLPIAPVAGMLIGIASAHLLNMDEPALAAEIEVETASAAPPAATDSAPPPGDLNALIDRLRACGVRACRACSPDLLAQLNQAASKPVDTVLCSLMDAAGGSSLSAVVLRTMGRDMLAGIEAIGRAAGASRLWLVADSNVIHRASALVRKAGSGKGGPNGSPAVPATPTRVRVVELENDYPQADPTLMLYALLGRRLRPGHLPTEASVIVLDAVAAAAVGRAALRNEPMLDMPVEVRDSARSRSTVYTAAVGLPVRHLLEAAGLKPNQLTLRAGAALRDVRVPCDAVVDGGGELSIDAGPLAALINPDPCIRCGWCVEACPVRIHPAGLLEAAQEDDLALAGDYGLHACIECGICSYVCPSRLPLLPAIRVLRQQATSSVAS